MRKYTDQYFFLVFIVMGLVAPTTIFANSLLSIVPAALTLGVGTTSSGTMQYTVTNNTQQPINQLIIDPAYQSSGNPSSISVTANTCSAVNLLPNASCTFNVLINGIAQPNTFQLRPRVCGYNGVFCSVPLSIDALQVTVSPSPTVVTVTPSGDVLASNVTSIVLTFNEAINAATVSNSTVSLVQSAVNTNLLGACVASSGNTVFTCTVNSALVSNQLYTVAVNNSVQSVDGVPLAAGFTANFTTSPRFAYVASYNGQFVSICPISNPVTGVISSTCSQFSSSGASGVTVNPAGTILYITNANNCPNSTVTSCNINNSNGSLSGCVTVTDSSFCYPTAVSINGNIAYVNNYGNNTVSNCTIQSNGSLTNCSVSTLPNIAGHNYGYDGIALNSSGSLLYVTQAQSSSSPAQTKYLLACPVQNGVVLGGGTSCVSYTSPFSGLTAGIALNSLSSMIYVANVSPDAVTTCPVNADGSFGNCSSLTASIFNSQQFGKVALNAAGTYVYVVNQNGNYVSLCQLNPDGTFIGSNACNEQLASLGLNAPQGIALL